MTPHFPIWSFGLKIESVDGICHQTDSMNIFYLDVKTGPKYTTKPKPEAIYYPIKLSIIFYPYIHCSHLNLWTN